MKHPLEWIVPPRRKVIFLVLLICALVMFVIFLPLSAPLTTPAAPSGIVSFELARTPANAQAMITSWDARSQLYASFGLGFDFLFMPIYAIAIAMGCLLAAGRHPGLFARIGAWLGWGAFLATVFDTIENIGLWNSLLGHVQSTWPVVSFWCAIFKFGLIMVGILYGIIGWIWPKKVQILHPD